MLNDIAPHHHYDVYQPRAPRTSQYYRCVEAHFEELEAVWDERYERRYGFWRPHIRDVIYQFLDCGDLHCGFARIKCEDCGEEFLLPFSCKRRNFCPSCHQKRVVEFGEWLEEAVLESIPHRHWVFSLPKCLRIYFMYDRSLLADLSQCAWKTLSAYLKASVTADGAIPGAVIAVQTFGDFQNFHPHLHIIGTDGGFLADGSFAVCHTPDAGNLAALFRHHVLKMLKAKGKINDAMIENMMGWRHNSGFNVYCGQAIWPDDGLSLENLARYIIRASFSQERMIYVPKSESPDGQAKVIYQSKDGKTRQVYDALDWLAQLITHIPNKHEQMVRYYGFYSNKSRGLRARAAQNPETDTPDESEIPMILNPPRSSKAFRKNWARLIQKIYEVDPLLCPKCQGKMHVISIIEDNEIIRKILTHLDLRDTSSDELPFNKGSPATLFEPLFDAIPPNDFPCQI